MKMKKVYAVIPIIILVFSSIFLVFTFLGLWNYDFNVPLFYWDGDNLSTLLFVKRITALDNFFLTEQLGAPLTALNIDFPLYGDSLNLVILKLISGLFTSYGIAVNLFYISLFPITAIVSYYVMKELEVNTTFAILGSLSFTFLPYRFLRSTAHIFLSAYCWIPLVVLVLLWFILDDKIMCLDRNFFRYKKNYIVIITLSIVSVTGIYYAFFTGFFITVVILIKLIHKFEIKTLFKSILLYSILIIPLLISMIPNLILKHQYGNNPIQVSRSYIESEIYGMKITQLFLPNQSHGIPFIEEVKERYANAPLPNEGSEYLGLLGVCGFIFLLILLFYSSNSNQWKKVKILSKLNIAAVLLGTIGGFGAIFSITVSPLIRAYNRISVFIAYFAILAACIGLTYICKKIKASPILHCLICVLLFVGILEQAFFYKVEEHNKFRESYYSDEKFVKNIENQVSKNAMIYQLPYLPFPESPPQNSMGDYALARGYLHSNTLRWSYGDQKGRDSDLLHRGLTQLETSELIDKIVFLGFEGIYIDSYAYTEEQLIELKEKIEFQITSKPLISNDNRLLFYNLNEYSNKIKEKYIIEEQKINSLVQYYTNGFSEKESDGVSSWRWCNQSGDLFIYNMNKEPLTVSISMTVVSGYPEDARFFVQANGIKQEYTINSTGVNINFMVSLQEGKNSITFMTDAQRVDAPADARELYMNFSNVIIKGINE